MPDEEALRGVSVSRDECSRGVEATEREQIIHHRRRNREQRRQDASPGREKRECPKKPKSLTVSDQPQVADRRDPPKQSFDCIENGTTQHRRDCSESEQ